MSIRIPTNSLSLIVRLACLAAFVAIVFLKPNAQIALRANMLLVEGLNAYARGEAPCGAASGLVEQFEVGSRDRLLRALIGLDVLECVPEDTRTLVTSRAYRDGDALLQFQLGRYLERQGQMAQAVDFYKRSGVASTLAGHAYRQGVECRGNGNVECQEHAWLRAVQLSPSPYYCDAIVGLYLAEGRVEDAADVLDNAAAATDDPVFAHLARGRSLYLRKEHAAAVLELQKAADLAPDNVDAQYYLGIALKYAGRFREAKEVLIHVVEHRPESFWALVVLSETCLKLAQWDEALQWYDRALALRTNVSSVYSGKGLALIRLGRMQEARDALVEALRLDPSNPYARRYLEQLNSPDG